MFGRKKFLRPEDVWYTKEEVQKRAEIPKAIFSLSSTGENEISREFKRRIEEGSKRHREELAQKLIDNPYYDPYKTIRKQNIDERGTDCKNMCVISYDYLIDAWLTLAQLVYYDPTIAKSYKKEIDSLNVLLMGELSNRLRRNGGYYTRLNEGVYDKLKSEFNEDTIIWKDFKFRMLNRDDVEYLQYLTDYCKKKYNTEFARYDSTISKDLAIGFINDFVLNGLDYNFETYNVSEKELKNILTYRFTRKINKDEFLALSDYGKVLLKGSLLTNDLPVYIYPFPIKVNKGKLSYFLEQNTLLYMKKKYGLNQYEMKNDLTLNTKNIDAVINDSLSIPDYVYPIYYYDRYNDLKVLDIYSKINNSISGKEKFTPQEETISTKQLTKAILEEMSACTIYNPVRRCETYADDTYQSASDYRESIGVKSTKYGPIIETGKREETFQKDVFYIKDMLNELGVGFDFATYLDYSYEFQTNLKFLKQTQDYEEIQYDKKTIHSIEHNGY